MPYIIRSKKAWTGGGLSVIASSPREALDHANELIERGTLDVEVVELAGKAIDLATLEGLVRESEGGLSS